MKLLLHGSFTVLLLCGGALAQTAAITLAGQGGYRTPPLALTAAPGQVLVLHVFGLTAGNFNQVVATPQDGEFPKVLNGISVDLVEGAKTTSLPIRAIYQGYCGQTGDCSTLTGITLQMPFELTASPQSGKLPALRVSENGKPAGGVLLRVVPDNVHVLNTCDDTQIYVSAAYSVPQDVCASVVMHDGKLNSLYNVARGGQEVALWAYGLGAKTEQSAQCCNSPEQFAKPVQPFKLNFTFGANVPPTRALTGVGLTADPSFAAYVGGGMYQLNFALPAVPADLPACDGVKVKSNLTITVTGTSSEDAAQICVTP